MIIKFIKNTRKHRINQVIKGDYKLLIHQVKAGNAVESNEDELRQYIQTLPKPKKVGKKETPVPKGEKVVPSTNTEEEECIPCKKKRNARRK